MRNIILSALVGLSLVAANTSVASAASNRIGDRVGATSSKSDELAGIPLPVLLIGAAVLVGIVVVATDDDSESD